ncbi:FAD-dependent oxidoreductase [Sphaerisporangium krabiense]|uniref:Glycine/D-amino acid oxidase-like deaminating enzyme n=1 Tax=Sphaerisporangium krabiense TaxID=763782 RepID=A0A7W8ZBS9_9ACTN|nr:FAD-binding oxidoreductase [Sphaerisporangium krabiense]MBB5630995.1 glycine/D-amino acid oxidase-like deaminating enzyme [Sphaerisporangium krabiense]GII65878.1 FAD-dependent oxidoreductase [Sphaerisporangium krabiense]
MDGTGGRRLDGTPLAGDFANGGVSFWYRQIGLPARRRALPGGRDYDVAIVGGGYTGMWTAYYLKKAQPDLRIAILEKEFAGFGASGRNGGWLSAEFAGSRERYARARGRQAMIDLQHAMFTAVDEVIAVARAEGIDADVHKGGLMQVATNPAQNRRLHAELAYLRRWGFGEQDARLLTREEQEDRVRIAGAYAAVYSPHCARIQPAKLAVGLARAVEALGVDVFEGTTVREIRPRTAAGRASAVTDRGTVTAEYVIRATEGFTAGIKGQRRQWLPMNSSMIVTEPLGEEVWERVGWRNNELLGDEAHAYCYAQRTADGRIAIGGRGVPYRFGSRTDHRGATQPRTVAALREILTGLFPAASGARVQHAWCGVLGVPRDWCSTVHLDHATGLGWAGGYVGSGVTTTNLAGRTLRDLVLRRDTELTALPWVGRRVRQWEPEPLRWIGVQAIYTLFRAADRHENARMSRTSAYARIAELIAGR